MLLSTNSIISLIRIGCGSVRCDPVLGESAQFLFGARLRIPGPWIILLRQRDMPIRRLSKLSKNSSEIRKRVLKNGRGSIKLF